MSIATTARAAAAAALGVLTLGIGLVNGASADSGPSNAYRVANTGGSSLNIHSAPQLGATVVGTVPAGSALDIACQITGGQVNGTNGGSSAIWDRLGSGGYVSDLYTDTPAVGAFSSGIPQCDTASSGASAPNTAASLSAADFHGVNWAASADNFMSGPVVPVGLTPNNVSCDGADYNSVHSRADAILTNLQHTLSGVNTIRFPINPASVLDRECASGTATWWDFYKGAIDAVTQHGMNVILGFWEANLNNGTGGTTADTSCNNGQTVGTTCFDDMWNTVVNDYASNPNVYFEPMNEPHGYSAAGWEQVAENWVNTYTQIPRGRIVISGSGYNSDVQSVGEDGNLNGTLLSLHYYNNWCGGESLASCVGAYASRTIVDEFGDTMNNGTNYNDTDGNADISYLENATDGLRGSGMGSVYWPGLGGQGHGDVNGDPFRLLNLNSDNTVTATNQSGVDRVAYGWGASPTGVTPCVSAQLANGVYIITNSSSEDAVDVPQFNTANGVDLEQWPVNNGSNQQWSLTQIGCDLYSITSVATGKSMDINNQSTVYGAHVDQWDYWHGGNQQFVIEPAAAEASTYVIASLRSLYPVEVPGDSNTAGTLLDQWGWNGGTNQQWSLTQIS
jgi:hypothetical protein